MILLMIDLDHFKQVNDTYGHHVGDVALQACAAVLQRESREFDVAARHGGEEFTVLLPNTGVEDGLVAAERLRTAISGEAVLHGGGSFHLTASIGVAALRYDETIDALLQRADEALYAAKQAGRNRVALAAGDLPPQPA